MSDRQPPRFDEFDAETFEKLIVWRRDVRHFRRDPIDPELIDRLIALSCLAPSVGNAQPWRFVKVEQPENRVAVRVNFISCNSDALHDYSGERAKLYATLKLSGLDDAPVQLAVFCDRETEAGHGLGQRTMPATLDYSVVAAIHTFWLAARLRGLGVGWVSIIEPDRIKDILEVPDSWSLVAYLCVGRMIEESDEPELVRYGWQDREMWEKFVTKR
jgi:5,6-dimethylbenzimidazole synthase